ncbi:MAG: GNAT family N-acetyltransferase [Nitriliruptoraceae bacterium]
MKSHPMDDARLWAVVAPGTGLHRPTGDPVIELRTHDNIPATDSDVAWEDLLADDPSATVFHSPRYLRLWHETLGQRFPIRVHTFHQGDELVGVIADANDRAGGPVRPLELRRFLGGTEVTDYLGPIARPEHRADVADAYLRNLAADVDWDEFIAGGLIDDAGWADEIRRSAEMVGLEVLHEEVEAVCPRVDLTGGLTAYHKRLSGRVRQEMQRKQRKLARDVGELTLIEVAADDVEAELDRFFEQALASFPEKASFFRRDEIRAWFSALGREFAGERTFRLHRLDAGGLPAAMTVSLVGQGEWGLYNSSFDVDIAAFAPGQVLIWMLIEEACDEDIEVFDLLRGDEAYKYRYGAVDRKLDRLVIGRPDQADLE